MKQTPSLEQDFVRMVSNLVNGGPFDLTDSPESFILNVKRFVKEYGEHKAALSSTPSNGGTPDPWRIEGTELIPGLSDSGPLKHAVIRDANERWVALVEIEDAKGLEIAKSIVNAHNAQPSNGNESGLREALEDVKSNLISATQAGYSLGTISMNQMLISIDAALARSPVSKGGK